MSRKAITAAFDFEQGIIGAAFPGDGAAVESSYNSGISLFAFEPNSAYSLSRHTKADAENYTSLSYSTISSLNWSYEWKFPTGVEGKSMDVSET